MSKFLLRFLAVLLFCAVASFGAYAWISSDSEPTHPALRSGNLPGLIPVREFYANTDATWGHIPSYDGTLLAWWGVKWGSDRVFVGRTDRIGSDGPEVVTVLDAPADSIFWSAFENKLHVLSEGRLWLVDPGDSSRSEWLDVTPRGLQNWNVFMQARTREGRSLIISNDRDPALVDLYTVRPDGGAKELLAKNEGKTENWIIGIDGIPRVRVDKADNDDRIYMVRSSPNAPWREFARITPFDTLDVSGISADGKTFDALDNRGGNLISLVKFDAKTGVKTVVFSDPNADVEVLSLSPNAASTDLAIVRDGFPRYVGLTEKGETFLRLLDVTKGPVDFNIRGGSPDGRFFSLSVSRDEAP
ncbi:MAG: hypothetical protein ACREB5_02685, partial [Sphingomonadaceae bacterium]